jgi:hypothetical protein
VYFPIYRDQLFELQAVRDVAPSLVSTKNIVPVFEPFAGQCNRLVQVADTGLRCLIILNPNRGPFQDALPPGYGAVLAHPQFVHTMRVDTATTVTDVTNFAVGKGVAFYCSEVPAVTVTTAIDARNPEFVLFERGLLPWAGIHRDKCVEIADEFHRRSPNSAYAAVAQEQFSDRYATIAADRNFAHFGDHSVEGYHEPNGGGGGGASTAAIHHVYVDGPVGRPILVRHYVSTYHNTTRGEDSLKVLDAMQMLVNDLPYIVGRNALNDTPSCGIYRQHVSSNDGCGLAKVKQYSLMHHLETMVQIV